MPWYRGGEQGAIDAALSIMAGGAAAGFAVDLRIEWPATPTAPAGLFPALPQRPGPAAADPHVSGGAPMALPRPA
jgi:hypothetical protein